MGNGHPSFVGKRQQHIRCEAVTTLHFNAATPGEKAGLLAFQDEHHFYFACRSKDSTGRDVVQLYRSSSTPEKIDLLAEVALQYPDKDLKLRIRADGGTYGFDYAEGQQGWHILKDKVDGKFLSTQVAGGFVGSLFALYGTSTGAPSKNQAIFRSLQYTGRDKVYE